MERKDQLSLNLQPTESHIHVARARASDPDPDQRSKHRGYIGEGESERGRDYETVSRTTLLPPDWTPTAELVGALTGTLRLKQTEIDECLENFRLYWTVGTGAGKRRARWNQSFLNWCKNYLRFSLRPDQRKTATKQKSSKAGFSKAFLDDMDDMPF